MLRILNIAKLSNRLRRYYATSGTVNADNSRIVRSTLQYQNSGQGKLNFLWFFPIGVGYLAWNLYQEGEAKVKVIEKRNSNLGLPPVPLPYNPTEEQLAELDHRQVYVSGELLHERELRVAPRYHESQLGIHIFTPLRRKDGSIVIINRGWVPTQLIDPGSRAEAQITERVTILGHLIPGDDPHPLKLFSEKPFLEVVNSPERNSWPRVDVQEMANWVHASPILISAVADPPNPGGYPIGGQTEFRLKNTTLMQAYQFAGLGLVMAAAIVGGQHFRRLGIRLPWQKKPPSTTPFTVQ